MISSCVRQSHPDEVVDEAVAIGIGAGSEVEESVSSDMALSFQACILAMVIRSSCRADLSGKIQRQIKSSG